MQWLERDTLLTFDEIERLTRIAVAWASTRSA